MCPSPAEHEDREIRPGQHHFIRTEYFDKNVRNPLTNVVGAWVQIAGSRLPDNRANRRKLEQNVSAMLNNGMRARVTKYEVREEIVGVIFGEGAVPGLK